MSSSRRRTSGFSAGFEEGKSRTSERVTLMEARFCTKGGMRKLWLHGVRAQEDGCEVTNANGSGASKRTSLNQTA